MIGRYGIKAVLFPYANKLVTNYLDGEVNEKFGVEFSKILEKSYYIIKENMIEPLSEGNREQQESKAFLYNSSKFYFNYTDLFKV